LKVILQTQSEDWVSNEKIKKQNYKKSKVSPF